MVDPISVADQGVGYAAKIQQAVPISVVARQARHFQAEHNADVTQCDFSRHTRKSRALLQARS